MTEPATTAAQNPTRSRRRWLRRLIRAAAAGLVLLVIAACTLPYWFPTTWLRNIIAAQLSQLSQRDVQVGRATLDWDDGVEIQDIRIADDATRGGRLLELDAVRCGLTPLRWLRGGGLDRLELIRPTLHLQIRPDGRLNLADLPAPPPGRPVTARLIFREVVLQIAGPRPGREPQVRVGDIEMTLDPVDGAAKFSLLDGTFLRHIGVARSDGTWTASATLHAPAAKLPVGRAAPIDAVPFRGEATFAWKDVDLSSLPLHWWPAMQGVSIGGRCSGDVRVDLRDDLNHAFELHIVGADLDYHAGQRDARHWKNATIAAKGVWKSTQDVVTLSAWRVELPWMVAASRPLAASPDCCLEFAARSEQPLTMRGSCHVSNLAEMAQELSLPSLVEMSGGCDLDLALTQNRAARLAEIELRGRDAGVRIGNDFEFARGTPLEIKLAVEAGPRWKVNQGDIRIGDARLKMTANVAANALRMPLSDEALLSAAWHDSSVAIQFDTSDLALIMAMFPTQANNLATNNCVLQGPLRAELKIAGGTHPSISISTTLDTSAKIAIGDSFHKRIGEPLIVAFSADQTDVNSLDHLTASMKSNDAGATLSCRKLQWRWNRATSIPTFDLLGIADWKADQVERLLALSPAASASLSRSATEISGELDGAAAFEFSGRWTEHLPDIERFVLTSSVIADGIDIDSPNVLCKPRDEPATISAQVIQDGRPTKSDTANIAIHSAALDAQINPVVQPDQTQIAARLQLHDAADARKLLPFLDRALGPVCIDGPVALNASATMAAPKQSISVAFNATDSAITTPSSAAFAGFKKPRNVQADMQFDCSRLSSETGDTWAIGPTQVRLWDNVLTLAGKASVRPLGVGDESFEQLIQHLDMEGWADIDLNQPPLTQVPAMADWLALHHITGKPHIDWQLRGTPDHLRVEGALDAQSLSAVWPGVLHMQAPAALTAKWNVVFDDVGAIFTRPASADHAPRASAALGISAAGAQLFCHALVPLDDPAAPTQCFAEIVMNDAARLGELMDLHQFDPRGGLHASTDFLASAEGISLQNANVAFDHFRLTTPDHADSFELSGACQATPSTISAGGLEIRIGRSDLVLAANVSGAEGDFHRGLRGELNAVAERLDIAELQAGADRWSKQFTPASAPALDAPPAEKSISPDIIAFAAASDFRATLHIRDALIPHLAGAGPFDAKELVLTPSLINGDLRLPFDCSVNGGVVNGLIATSLINDNPFFDLTYAARQLTCEPNTRPLVEAFFPGLVVTGPITLIDATHQRLYDRPGIPNPELGDGEMILEGGHLVGRAAPILIANLFPGLNLARYDFTRMENRFEKDAESRMHNHMVFFGKYYDMYIDGVSFPDGRIRYEVGIDLYAGLLPDLSRASQGRIALFIKTGMKGPNNTMLDETVWYLRPDQIMAKILSDNLLTQTYHALKRAMIGKS